MITIKLGNKKKSYRSIKLAAEASGIKYITLYMRLRAGDKPVTAVSKKVRKYQKVQA